MPSCQKIVLQISNVLVKLFQFIIMLANVKLLLQKSNISNLLCVESTLCIHVIAILVKNDKICKKTSHSKLWSTSEIYIYKKKRSEKYI